MPDSSHLCERARDDSHLTLDLSDVEDAAVGDAVLLLGGDGDVAIGLGEFAAWSGRRELDTVLALSGRLAAHYRGASRI